MDYAVHLVAVSWNEFLDMLSPTCLHLYLHLHLLCFIVSPLHPTINLPLNLGLALTIVTARSENTVAQAVVTSMYCGFY